MKLRLLAAAGLLCLTTPAWAGGHSHASQANIQWEETVSVPAGISNVGAYSGDPSGDAPPAFKPSGGCVRLDNFALEAWAYDAQCSVVTAGAGAADLLADTEAIPQNVEHDVWWAPSIALTAMPHPAGPGADTTSANSTHLLGVDSHGFDLRTSGEYPYVGVYASVVVNCPTATDVHIYQSWRQGACRDNH